MRLEHENDYGNVNGKANAGLTLGIIGTALSALNGGLGNLGVGAAPRGNWPEAQYTRYDAAKDAEIAALKSAIELRDANTYTDQKLLEVYRYVDGRIDGVNAAINAQAVYNATNSATIGCINNQVATLMALTKVVVPTSSICPEPMLKYNSWTAPTTSTTT
jgi:hypothetical protein